MPEPAASPDPDALGARAFGAAVKRFVQRDRPFAERLERVLVDVAPDEADALMMLLKEGRGTWALFLHAPAGSSVLFVGDARSGTAIALATLGYLVTVVDRCALRLRFARERAEALAPGRVRFVHARIHGGARLPFADGAFAVGVQEPGGDARAPLAAAEELWRVARDEVFDVRVNRLAYKRSLGRRGAFERGPLSFARVALRAPGGERTLRAARRAVARGAVAAEAYALYPHALEFSHVVGLDGGGPRLSIGPRERRNHLKMLAKSAGLFRVLTPSFGIHGRRRSGRARLDVVLDGVAESLGTERPKVDVFVATRSNNALVLTSGAARWALHVPMQPSKERLVTAHFRWLEEVRRRHPDVPVPEPLLLADIGGAHVSVEERIDGLGGTEVTGDAARTAALLTSTAELVARLVDERPTMIDAATWSSLMDARVAGILRPIRSAATRRAITERAERFRDHVLGRDVRLATYHADLRGKHIAAHEDGRARALLDWGASESRFFPLADLLQLLVHQRKQERGGSFGSAWRSLGEQSTWTRGEREALGLYFEASSVARDELDAYLDAFPVFVAGMAERNWDFSRPDWVARQFGL